MHVNYRHTVKFVLDLTLWSLAVPCAFLIRLDGETEKYLEIIAIYLSIGLPLKGAALLFFQHHRRSWRRVGMADLTALVQSVVMIGALSMIVVLFLSGAVPRSVPVIEGMLAALALGGMRALWRASNEREKAQLHHRRMRKVLIIGAGEAGTMMGRELLRHPEAGLKLVGYLDDDPVKQRQRFSGVPVLGGIEALTRTFAEALNIEEVIIAMPSESGAVVRQVVEQAREARVKSRTIPGIYDLLSGKVSISQLREVAVEDLLRRKPVELDIDDIEGFIYGRVVLVTGAGGSIGAELGRQVSRFAPKRIIMLGRGENSVYQALRTFRKRSPNVEAVPVIADVRDRCKLDYVFRTYKPDVVFHAAAHKHVPLMELNPDEAVLNNILGTCNVAELAAEYRIERFVNISTDKAVNPSSIMGASKRMAEYVVEKVSRTASPEQEFVSVRFGNVLGSRGSVIPIFQEQIKQGGPVTVTDREMKRYFMTIPEAAQLVLQAAALGGNGRVYVLDMGEPVRIVDLAYDLIRLSGLEPEVDIPIIFTGVRSGEKLFEELLTAEEGTEASQHQQIYVARKHQLNATELEVALKSLIVAAEDQDGDKIREVLAAIIPVNTIHTAQVA